MSARRPALLGMLLALALVLGWVEHLLPVFVSVPGVKLGLANIVVVFALYKLGRGSALLLSCAKVLLSAMLFGGLSGLLYSAAGAALSYLVMLLLHRRKSLSPIGVSAAGGAAHVTAQLGVAILLTATPGIWRFLPVLMAVGTVTGALAGLVAALVLDRLKTPSGEETRHAE